MSKRSMLVLIISVVLIAAWWCWPEAKPEPGGPPTAVIETSLGGVRGFTKDGLDIFLGIPYAEPPVGQRRFKPAVVHEPWQEPFEAYAFGAFCPQVYDAVIIEDPDEDLRNEDCLTLNIWAPGMDGEKRAVIFYIHGGGFIGGATKETLYHSDVLAQKGDVVVVTANYRIGLLGFFDMSEIAGADYSGSANVGLEDQVLALKWVKENIAAFGGDPQNITVVGESAGGTSVKALLGLEHPHDYFNRAIIMSGAPLHTAENTSAIANLLKEETGIRSPFLWKKMPTSLVIYIQDQVLAAVGSPLSDLIFAPTYGSDYSVKRGPEDSVAAGNTQGIDLMIGTMADELSYWSFYDSPDNHICEQTLEDNLFTMVSSDAEDQVRQLYDLYASNPDRKWTAEGDILLAMADDYAFRVPALNLASAQSAVATTYVYRFDYPVNLPDQPCQMDRSPHGGELPFLFGRINEQVGFNFIGKPRDAADQAVREHLMDQVIFAWSNFAKTGDPNGGDLPAWPTFDAESQPIMIFSANPHIENAPFYQEYKAMDAFMQHFSVFDALE